LAKHQPWDYKIFFKKEKKPTYKPVYELLQTKKIKFKDYINKFFKKGYIKPLTLFAGYPILFAKKNGTLRFYVNYRQLNEITVKNRYPLPLIKKLQHRTKKAKFLIKLNIRKAYYRIRIKKGKK